MMSIYPSLQDIRQNHWTMKYRSQWPKFILRSNIGSYRLIIPKYDVHISNSFQDIRQNHWTMKYRSQWPTFILRSNIVSYWLIFQKFDVHHQIIHPSNSLPDMRQNCGTVEYSLCWPSPHEIQVNGVRLTDVWPTISINCLHNRKAENHFLKVS